MAQSKLSSFWRKPDLGPDALTGVSLHSHTNRSKESLYFIPQLAQKCPLLHAALEKQCKMSAIPVDFAQAYWTPPLNPKQAYELEKNQIENVLGLASMVLLTDHDNIDAPSLLRSVPETANIPLALEWSVPFRGTIFHLGVHNLPAARAQVIVGELSAYTRNPNDALLVELLAMLDELPEALVVFNHPLWNQSEVGKQRRGGVLERFMHCSARFLHALEFNATRKLRENKDVLRLAERWQLPLVGGGDRHGCEPSAALNVTRAQSFPEFVHEIRREQRSHVMVMPQYTAPLSLRTMKTLLDVIREYPEFPAGSRRWEDRVFHPDSRAGGEDRSLSALWEVSPAFIEHIFSVVRVLENSTVQRTWARLFGGALDAALPPEKSAVALERSAAASERSVLPSERSVILSERSVISSERSSEAVS
jgi:hypothetical protein